MILTEDETGTFDLSKLAGPNLDELKDIYRRVAIGEGGHGSFLVAFAEAYIRADYENSKILRPAAEVFIKKYDLR